MVKRFICSIIFRLETIDSSRLLRINPLRTYRYRSPQVILPKLSHNGKHEDFINPKKRVIKSGLRDNFGAYWLATLISGVLTFTSRFSTNLLSFSSTVSLSRRKSRGRSDRRRGENGRRAILLPPWRRVPRRREGESLKRIGKDGGARRTIILNLND